MLIDLYLFSNERLLTGLLVFDFRFLWSLGYTEFCLEFAMAFNLLTLFLATHQVVPVIPAHTQLSPAPQQALHYLGYTPSYMPFPLLSMSGE